MALLDMKAALDAVLHQSFQSAEPFAHALKDAFEHFINQRANRPVRAGAKGCCGIPFRARIAFLAQQDHVVS